MILHPHPPTKYSSACRVSANTWEPAVQQAVPRDSRQTSAQPTGSPLLRNTTLLTQASSRSSLPRLASGGFSPVWCGPSLHSVSWLRNHLTGAFWISFLLPMFVFLLPVAWQRAPEGLDLHIVLYLFKVCFPQQTLLKGQSVLIHFCKALHRTVRAGLSSITGCQENQAK